MATYTPAGRETVGVTKPVGGLEYTPLFVVTTASPTAVLEGSEVPPCVMYNEKLIAGNGVMPIGCFFFCWGLSHKQFLVNAHVCHRPRRALHLTLSCIINLVLDGTRTRNWGLLR